MNTMIWIDTNVVVRFLVADDADQFRQADQLIRENEVFVALTVLLECEWVLRDNYALSRPQVVWSLRQFLRLPTVKVEETERAMRALDWAEHGMDFADALHLAGCGADAVFVSFDLKLVKAARRLGAPEVRSP